MAQPTGSSSLEFYTDSRCMSANAKKTIEQKAHQKNRPNSIDRPEEGDDIIISESVLRRIFNEDNIVKVLRCSCKICIEVTETVPKKDDEDMARQIAADKERLILLATLAFIGGTFAMRLLSRHAIHNVDQALDPDRMSHPRESLFRRFTNTPVLSPCCHSPKHTKSNAMDCLDERFRECLRAKAWILRIPAFQANNLARQFSDRQNMPFINEQPLSYRLTSESRQFFQFMIHEEFCDEKLKGNKLFRKQLSTSSQHVNARVHIQEERDILVFLKDLHHPNICEVLFAYAEEYEQRYSLVFKFHSYDLEKILYPRGNNHTSTPKPQGAQVQFPGSKLENWIWKGFLGIIDAVAAVHDPQNSVSSIPKSNSHRLVGGHFDIKPANIIIDDNGVFLLTDFGQAYFKNVKIGEESNLTINAGTYNYRPPPRYSRERAEQTDNVETKNKWTRAYDIWSLACVSVEIIAFIIEGADAADKFFEERQLEDAEDFGKFWTGSNGAPMLKKCVQTRLDRYKSLGDKYLNRVVKQIEDMFKINELVPITAKACLQSFSASVEVDRYMFRADDDDLVGGTGTFKPFEKMRTTFSTARVLTPLRCSLYLWRSRRKDSITLTLEFPATDGGTISMPIPALRTQDEFIPTGLFDVEALFQDSQPLSDLQCSFRNMHNGTIFHMSKKWDFYHLQGAVTHQFTCDGSEVRIRSCSFARPRRQETRSFRSGHMQVWRYLTDGEYDDLYCKPTVPAIVLPEIHSMEDNSSSKTSFRKPKPKPSNTEVTLAIYLCGPNERTLFVMPLNEDAYNHRFYEDKDGRQIMIFERKLKASEFAAAVFDRPSPDTLPGIPLSEEVLLEKINTGKGMKRLEVEFWNSHHREKFQKFYESIWK